MNYSTFLSPDNTAIFLFHGVVKKHVHPIRNYTYKHIDASRFTEILKDLSAHGKAVSMPEIVAAHRSGRSLPAGAFSITFDDGFENNYSVAAPILEDMKIPAMFYVTTGFVEVNACSWIDMIEYAVET